MKKTALMILALWLWLCPLSAGPPASWAYPTPSPVTTDIWDISQGITIDNTSGAIGSSKIEYMFGQDVTPGDTLQLGDPTGNLRGPYQATVFADGQPQGYVHNVEWHTTAPVNLGSFTLLSHSDYVTYPEARAVASFILKAKLNSGDSWTTLYNSTISGAQWTVYSYDPDVGNKLFWLGLSVDVDPMMAEYFYAGFTTFGGAGPRVVELDGFAAPIPLPASVLLLGSGLLGLGGYSLKRRLS